MISVGIDVSKGKSTVCILKPYGEIVCKPFEIEHEETNLNELVFMLKSLNDEVKVVLEATGIYHLPVVTFLQKNDIFVSVINPLRMKRFRTQSIRKGKTDKLDATTISNYGIEHWYSLEKFKSLNDAYNELKILGQQYRHYMEQHVCALLELTHLLDYTMPGIKKILCSYNENTGKDKLSDFVCKYWHFDIIKSFSKEDFIADFTQWAKDYGYHQNKEKAINIYELASKGITTLSSQIPSTKTLVQEAVRVFKEINIALNNILSRMQTLASSMPEYEIVRSMSGVGDTLAAKLIAEIGDIRKFHSGKSLVAYAGIDAPPFQSGQFNALSRKISKRGSSSLRKIGYEVMRSLKLHKYVGDPVYEFIIKKENEGKAKKVAKIAGLNKFLRIYYARVIEVYNLA